MSWTRNNVKTGILSIIVWWVWEKYTESELLWKKKPNSFMNYKKFRTFRTIYKFLFIIRRSYSLTLSLVFIFDIWFTSNLLHKQMKFVYITWISIVRYKTKKRNNRISIFMKGFSDLLSLIYFCAVFLE